MTLNTLLATNHQILEAEKQIELNNFTAARLLLTELIVADRKNLEALNDLAVVEILSGNFDSALSLLMEILNNDAQNEVAIGNLEFVKEKFSAILSAPEES